MRPTVSPSMPLCSKNFAAAPAHEAALKGWLAWT